MTAKRQNKADGSTGLEVLLARADDANVAGSTRQWEQRLTVLKHIWCCCSGNNMLAVHLKEYRSIQARMEALFMTNSWVFLFVLFSSWSSGLTSQQVRGEMSREGSNQQPVALRGQLPLLIAIRALQALVEHPWPRPPAGWYTATGAGWSSPSEADSGTVRAVGVPKPRDPFPAAVVSRWEIGAGISPGSAVEHRAALLAPHDQF